MILILAASYAEGKTFLQDHRLMESDTVLLFDMKDLATLDSYEFQSLFVTNGFLSKPKLHDLWRKGITRVKLPKREEV